METETHILVRYAETDRMGIAHHSNYLIWFEAGKTDFLKKAGLSNSNIENKGILLPLSHLECEFKSPANFEDEIVVKTKIKKMTGVKIEFQYVIINNNGKLIATGNTTHAWTDKSLKIYNIEKKSSEINQILKAAIN